MYQAPARADGKHLEYVELFNTNPWQEDIGGYQLAGDITYTFPIGITIAGGGFVVVGKAPADLQSVYGLKDVLGPFENAPLVTGILQLLNNGTTPAVYLEVPYLSLGPWTVAAHGTGYSLVLKRPSYGEGFVEAWGVSELLGGSPGAMETYIPSPLRSVAMNEFLAHPGDAVHDL